MAGPDPANDLSHSTSTCSKLPPPFIYRLKGNVILYIIPKFSILRNYIDKSEDLTFGSPCILRIAVCRGTISLLVSKVLSV